ncbi:MAG: hypothetical protein KIS72_02785 [Luteimonas sp.]|nr:hypothetical protein [Luteimonas sp.]
MLKGDVIEYRPKHIGSLCRSGLKAPAGGNAHAGAELLRRCLHHQHTAGRNGVDDAFLKTQSLFTVDLSAIYALSEKAELYARIDNVLDEQKDRPPRRRRRAGNTLLPATASACG